MIRIARLWCVFSLHFGDKLYITLNPNDLKAILLDDSNLDFERLKDEC